MVVKKPGKVAVHRAAKVLSNPHSTKKAKSSAAKTLAKRAISVRTVKPPPKRGTVGRSSIKSAVRKVSVKKKSSFHRK